MCAASSRVLTHEFLARSYLSDGDGLSPGRLISAFADEAQLVPLGRLCRAVHTLNLARSDRRNRHDRLWEALAGEFRGPWTAWEEAGVVEGAQFDFGLDPVEDPFQFVGLAGVSGRVVYSRQRSPLYRKTKNDFPLPTSLRTLAMAHTPV
ncbi:MAG: hypothetical protein WBP72_01555, partial [Rhodocyclaceae bacterium]